MILAFANQEATDDQMVGWSVLFFPMIGSLAWARPLNLKTRPFLPHALQNMVHAPLVDYFLSALLLAPKILPDDRGISSGLRSWSTALTIAAKSMGMDPEKLPDQRINARRGRAR